MFNIIIICILASLSLDYASFRINDSLSLVELYIAIPYTSISYTDSGEGKRTSFIIDIRVEDEKGDTLAEDAFERLSFIPSLEDARQRHLTMVDLFSFPLPYGKYTIYVSLNQKESKHTVKTPVKVSPYKGFSISDIMLASEIEESGQENQFTKSDYNIIPNPERAYGGNRKVVYVYTELYGLLPEEEYSIIYKITDTIGNTIKEYPAKTKISENRNIMEIWGINTEVLLEGSYLVNVHLSQKSDTVYTSKPFYLVHHKKISILDNKDREYYSFIDYIATPDELAIYRSSDDKDAFLEIFWAKRGENELLTYIENLKEADLLYGKKSDRARILITHGESDEVTRYLSQRGHPDSEVWWYYGEGGKVFIFCDLRGGGDYELIYSNYEREYTDPRYLEYIPPDLIDLLH